MYLAPLQVLFEGKGPLAAPFPGETQARAFQLARAVVKTLAVRDQVALSRRHRFIGPLQVRVVVLHLLPDQ